MDVSAALGAHSEPLKLDGPKVYHIPAWGDFEDPKRMDVIARIAKMRGHDPRMATLAVGILKEAGAQPRDYKGQAAALLSFVQHKLYYVNEPGERLSDPLRTLKVGYGDCDDLVIVLASLLESIRLPWRLTISGTNKRGKKLRYHQGEKFPGGRKKGYNWSHIYLAIGDRPFTPTKWNYAETTVRGAPLGWDVVSGDASALPEMNNYGAAMSYGQLLHKKTLTRTLLPSPTLTTGLSVSPGLTSDGANGADGANGSATFADDSGAVPGSDLPGAYAPARPAAPMGEMRADMVAVVVLRPDGRVLALHRSATSEWMPGRWDLPGGKVGGKPARAAAVKILAAEAGIKTLPERLRRCAAVYHPSAGTSVFYVLRLNRTEAEAAEIQVAEHEHQGWKWVLPRTFLAGLAAAPYVAIAFKACFKPRRLDPYAHRMVAAGTPVAETIVAAPAETGEAVSVFEVSASPVTAAQTWVSPNLLWAQQAYGKQGDPRKAGKRKRCPKGFVARYAKGRVRCVPRKSAYGALGLSPDHMLNRDYFGIPVWGYLAAGGAYYLYRRKK